ncbi:hypothetical protein F0U60_42025 [Archangium minus]|uniref:Uncharacterized protein n=1 Tax=Archangium minus TaxID=83450 RepID=A0ABY9X3M1_9BACT|nr:hypothetical protein F0U61_42165 [Archangium violaceum]WNG49975.1 hypothetical protein F0U60_42025 [Archangium minus]
MQHEGTDTKGRVALAGVTRAALLGLSGGLLLGGLFLLGVGLKTRFSSADCTGLSEIECSFAQEAALEMSRMQTISGAALLSLAIAVVVLLRSKVRPASH